ncbi:MAG: cobalt-zinc-cadmium efflux system outer membrane protein [Phycisphaerales bacterium]|jgi:cobalt-zinc-cadmium efflux system outer membrane protein
MKYKITVTLCFLAMIFSIGCQSYEPAPLQMDLYQTNLENRIVDIEPVQLFAERLALQNGVPNAFDMQDGISAEEGEVIALFYNPSLRIARLEAGVALANFETAGLWEDPVFGFQGADISSPSAPFQFGMMMNFTIPISGRLALEKERADSAYSTNLHKVANLEWNTRSLVQSQWSHWTAATMQVELLQEVAEQLERINAIADLLEASGEINRVERRLLKIDLVSYQVQITKAELDVLQAELALVETLGLPPTSAEYFIPIFPALMTVLVEDETSRIINANTELAVSMAQYQTAEDSLRLEIKKQFPDIVLGSGYGSEFNDHRVLIGVSIPLSIWNRNQAGIAHARTKREVARAKSETTFARIYRELALANTALSLTKKQRSYFDEMIIPLLKEQSKDIENIMNLGEVDMFMLLETVTRQHEAKKNLVTLQVIQLDAKITRNKILGPAYTIDTVKNDSYSSTENTLGGVQ